MKNHTHNYIYIQELNAHINVFPCIQCKYATHGAVKMKGYMTNLRINDTEKVMIRDKFLEINKKLIMSGKVPIAESEMVHMLLQKALKQCQITDDGDIKI